MFVFIVALIINRFQLIDFTLFMLGGKNRKAFIKESTLNPCCRMGFYNIGATLNLRLFWGGKYLLFDKIHL